MAALPEADADERVGRVLVVDDDNVIRDMLAMVLTDAGYEVTTAEHGRRALDLLSVVEPDVILMDLMMPVMDGRQFRQIQLTEHYPDPPLVILSACRDANSIGDELHAAAVVTKPFDLDDLLDTVVRLAPALGSRMAA
jgi:CheY-like chemotaxis protein